MSNDSQQSHREGAQRRRPAKGLYLLPAMFTAGNMAAGYYAISQAMQGTVNDPWHFDVAAKAIGVAIVLDFFDGGIARLTNTASAFGRELDSLADVIAFGVAPAVLALMWGFRMVPLDMNHDLRVRVLQLGAIASFVFLLAGASRLARFNIQVNPQPSNPGRPDRKYFVGMPIPAGAGSIAAVVHLVQGNPLQIWWLAVGWAVYLFAIAFLMVSTWRFFSLKGINFRQPQNFRWLIGIGATIALIWFSSEYVLFALALIYILSGVLARLSFVFRRPTLPPQPRQDEASHA
jgi:CDP-diacylglycerol--serine O-phosphatidyltransferase